MYTAIATASTHPDMLNPYWGLFNHRIINSLVNSGPEVDVASPRPFAPPVGPYSEYSKLPLVED